MLFPCRLVILHLKSILIVADQWLQEGSTMCTFSSASEPSHLSTQLAGTYLENIVKGEGRAKWIHTGTFRGCGQDLSCSFCGWVREMAPETWTAGVSGRQLEGGDCSQPNVKVAPETFSLKQRGQSCPSLSPPAFRTPMPPPGYSCQIQIHSLFLQYLLDSRFSVSLLNGRYPCVLGY